MNKAIARILLALAGAATCLTGCSEGKAPFRMVQFCLAGTQEIPAFTRFMNEIAQDYRMEFTDRNRQTEDELRALASENKLVPVTKRVVNIGADHGGVFSFGAGNLGMPAEQIVVGFNGAKQADARQFADAVVRKLSTRCNVHEVSQGHGAFPLAKCD